MIPEIYNKLETTKKIQLFTNIDIIPAIIGPQNKADPDEII